MKKLINYLNQPYPFDYDFKTILLEIAGISLFIFFFLLVFQPFGLKNVHESIKLLIIAGFGFVTFFVLVINLLALPKLFPSIFNENRWKIKNEIYSILLVLFTIGLGNAIYFGLIGAANS